MEILFNKECDLKKYGFIKADNRDEYFWFRKTKYRGGLNIIANSRTKTIHLQSASKDAIAVLCEMYKNGDISFVDDVKFTTMKLTKEEVELIEKAREK